MELKEKEENTIIENTNDELINKENINLEQDNIETENVENIVQQSVGQIFKRVLEDAGIFKSNDTGQQGLQKFIHEIE